MAAPWYSLVLVVLLLLYRAQGSVNLPECEEKDGGERVCALPSPPQRVFLLRDRLIIGAIDSLYTFSPGLELLDFADASPSPARLERCLVYEAHQPSLCRNILRVVQPVSDSSLLVCGTNAVFPKCRLVQVQNISSWAYMTPKSQKDVGFSPHSAEQSVAVLADNGAFFTATFFNFRQTQQTIGMAPSLQEAQFAVQTPSFSPSWLNDPVFLSAYQVGDHVYLLAREPAYEVAGERVEFSRAIRVCKNDTGFRLFPGDSTLTFRTFQKARLRCRAAGRAGSAPYDYNRLHATFLLRPSDGGDPTLYGAFSSAANGPQGAAVCKFSLAELNSVFESGEYLVLEKGGWTEVSGGSFACPGSSNMGSQRTEEQAKSHQLIAGVAVASDPQPMATLLGDEVLFLTADVVQYRGSSLEVVVAALTNGEITHTAWYNGSVYNNVIGSIGDRVTNMVLHSDPESMQRRVLLTTDTSLESVTLGWCSRYTTCLKCFDSHDPYCAWSEASGECVNKLWTAAALPDTLTSSEETITFVCGPRSSTPTTTPAVDPSSCPLNPDPPIGTDSGTTNSPSSPTSSSTGVTPAGLNTGTQEGREDAVILAGATVGGFLLGIPAGLVICYLFFSGFLKKGSRTQDGSAAVQVSHNPQLQRFGVYEKQSLPNTRYLEMTQRNLPTHNTFGKNVNQHSKEEDDVLTDLPPFSKASTGLHHSPQSLKNNITANGRSTSSDSTCL